MKEISSNPTWRRRLTSPQICGKRDQRCPPAARNT
jgi:hypothetical protein